ncbi:MAG: GNAT family N-acetyltransferase [Candidatus Lokiarchaeota archaeon]|nr:GNAT family N-acetyltransferase [Candidatus Lokiarchaeota archaeon]
MVVMMVEIIRYNPDEHYEAIKDLMKSLTNFWEQKFSENQFKASLARRISDPINKDGIILARDEDMILGMIWGEVIFQQKLGSHGRISNFVVRKEARGKGIGKKLIEAVINFFVEHNINRVRANARDMKKEGRLYLKYGFKPLYYVLESKLDMDYFTKSY